MSDVICNIAAPVLEIKTYFVGKLTFEAHLDLPCLKCLRQSVHCSGCQLGRISLRFNGKQANHSVSVTENNLNTGWIQLQNSII